MQSLLTLPSTGRTIRILKENKVDFHSKLQKDMSDAVVFFELWVPPPAVVERIEQQPECRLLWAVLGPNVAVQLCEHSPRLSPGRELFALHPV